MSTQHKSVLLKETIELLQLKEKGVYADLTLGGGGHFLQILDQLNEVTLVGFDLDMKSIEEVGKKLVELGFKMTRKTGRQEDELMSYVLGPKSVVLINDNFTTIKDYLELLKLNKVDGILADLGWSSDQLGNIAGLSYDNPMEELDMRLDVNLGVRAADLLNVLGRKELEKMFSMYADIYGNQNKKLVEEIIKFRKENLFSLVEDIIKVVDKAFRPVAVNRFKRNEKYSMYSKVFQALRIAVNSEFSNLEWMINNSVDVLNKNGRLEVITFHSGEEKIVRNIFERLEKENKLKIIRNNSGDAEIRPSVEELRGNIRSRSAKLFTVEIL